MIINYSDIFGQSCCCPPPAVGYITGNFAGTSSDAVTFISISSNSPVNIGSSLNLLANCTAAASYAWTGPNGFTSSEQNPVRPNITLADAGVYTVIVTYAGGCTGNANTNLVVINIPENSMIQNVFVSPGPPVCYNATQTIIVAGNGTNFMVQPGGNATMIAGHNIIYYPNTKVFLQGYMHGKITSDGTYCGQKAGSIVDAGEEGENPLDQYKAFFRVYPNPTTGNFSIVQSGENLNSVWFVEIYGILGKKLISADISGEKSHEFMFGEMPNGLYFIKIICDGHGETIKLVKSR